MTQRNFIPNSLKYKKLQKKLKRFRGVTSNSYLDNNESFILKNITNGRVSPQQLECSRRVIRRSLGREGLLICKVKCDLPLTSKSSGIRMGKGKGSIDKWVFSAPKGKIFFSLKSTSFFSARLALKKACKKYSGITKAFYNYPTNNRIFDNIYK
jgi:large subunit ribosomal protein L16